MVSEFNQWREILPSNMAAGLFIERLLGNKQSRMVERIGSIYLFIPLFTYLLKYLFICLSFMFLID